MLDIQSLPLLTFRPLLCTPSSLCSRHRPPTFDSTGRPDGVLQATLVAQVVSRARLACVGAGDLRSLWFGSPFVGRGSGNFYSFRGYIDHQRWSIYTFWGSKTQKGRPFCDFNSGQPWQVSPQGVTAMSQRARLLLVRLCFARSSDSDVSVDARGSSVCCRVWRTWHRPFWAGRVEGREAPGADHLVQSDLFALVTDGVHPSNVLVLRLQCFNWS